MKKLALIGILAVAMLVVSASSTLADRLFTTASVFIPIVLSQGNQTDVQVLQNHTYFVDAADYLHVIGEVQNNTANNLMVSFYTRFYDSSGSLLQSKVTFTNMDTLPAHDKTCFDVVVSKPSNWSYYKFDTMTYDIDPDPLPKLSLNNVSGAYDASTGQYKLSGNMKNDGTLPVSFAFAVGSLYNAEGKIVGCEFNYVDSIDLDPGKTSPFEMIFTGRNYSDVTSFRVQADD